MSENNDGYFDVYDNKDVNDLQDNGHDSNQNDSNDHQDDQVSVEEKKRWTNIIELILRKFPQLKSVYKKWRKKQLN